MKNITPLFFCLLILCVASEAWSQEKKPLSLELGASLSLTGELAYIGQSMLEGLTLAEEEINTRAGSDGNRVKVHVEDNAGEARLAISGSRYLIEQKNVPLLFTSFTHITQSMKALVRQRERVLYYFSTIPDMAREHAFTFKDYYDSAMSGTILGQEIIAREHLKLAVLSEQGDACELFVTSLTGEVKESGGTILISEEYNPDLPDFRSLLLKLRRGNPDAFAFCTWRHTHLVMRQLAELNMLGTPTFHLLAPFLPPGDSAEIRDLMEQNRAVTTWYAFSEVARGDQQGEFVEKFQKRFGRLPRPDSAYTYDALHAVFASSEKCFETQGKVTPACIAGNLNNITVQGAGGRLSFDADGVSDRPVLLIEMKDGKWEEVP